MSDNSTGQGRPRVLLVDDEPRILEAYGRGLRHDIEAVTATSGQAALALIDPGAPFPVVVSDMRMPGMDGVTFLKEVKSRAPDTVRIMLTGAADLDTAMKAVNEGNIFRFLTKPCPPPDLLRALQDGVRQFELVTAEKELLEKTLRGSVKVLTDLLSMVDPETFAFTERLRAYVSRVAPGLGMDNSWEIELAAMLAPIGWLTVPPELRTKVDQGRPLVTAELEMLAAVPLTGQRLLAQIPRLQGAAAIVAAFHLQRVASAELFPAGGPVGARLLRILAELIAQEDAGRSIRDALNGLSARPDRYDAELLARVQQVMLHDGGQGSEKRVELELTVRELQVEDLLKVDAQSADGRVLLRSGTKLNAVFLERLGNYRKLVGVIEPLRVERWALR